MRIVQLANFYGGRSGGLRTAVDRWGAGYAGAGHDVVLIVPGADPGEETLNSGVTRITVAAPRIPASGGYRLASARRVADVLANLRPDALEVSDRLTLRGFVVGAYDHVRAEFLQRVQPWLAHGQLDWDVTERTGLENAPDAFLELFSGGNTGKMIVKF